MSDPIYLHGFSRKEQNRLVHQARFLEPYVYSGIDLEYNKTLLEVGCGVGAQTEILCRRFPELNITGVDFSAAQLKIAKEYLKAPIKKGRVTLFEQNAQNMKLPFKRYDSAFLCWFLEHVPDPIAVLKNTKKHLKPGAKVYCSEVFNQMFFMEPYSPAFLKYLFHFNDYQWNIKGHPFVGARLGHLLKESGYHDIQVELRPFHFDSREPEKRAAFTEFFQDVLLSAKDSLLKDKRITKSDLKEMVKEFERVKKAKDSVFFFAFVRATARVPYK